MAETAPGLRQIFDSIRPVKLLKAVFEKTAPLKFDWEPSDDFAERLYAAMQEYAEDGKYCDLHKWGGWMTALYNINSIVHHYNSKQSYPKLVEWMVQTKLWIRMIEYVGIRRPTAQTIISWLYVNDSTIWDKLLENSESLDLIASGGNCYYVKPNDTMPEKPSSINLFTSDFLSLMKQAQTPINNLYVEYNRIHEFDRYIMHVPPFPRHVGTFQKKIFTSTLNDVAESFSIVYTPRKHMFRLKSQQFTKTQKDSIAKLFASCILGTTICDKPKEEYALERFNPDYDANVKPIIPADSKIISATPCGIKVDMEMDEERETIAHMSKHANIFKCIEKSICNYPKTCRKRLELTFRIVMQADDDMFAQPLPQFADMIKAPTKTYEVTISREKWESDCNDPAIEEELRRFCSINHLGNIAGQNVLKTSTRK